jgi:protein-L-isoaspartate(D-aspartate) O-methyltransferase
MSAPAVGYYTAILAELVGVAGRVTAIEFDAELAPRATANLAQTPHVRAIHGDGTRIMFEPADVIYINAGVTRPADAWLDRLKEGGSLILPLTANGFPNRDVRRGVVFRIERRGPEFLARRISGVATAATRQRRCADSLSWPRSTNSTARAIWSRSVNCRTPIVG